MFLQGACGDVSTRFTRRGQNFDEARRLGGLLADEALRLDQSVAAEEPVETISYQVFPVNLPLKRYQEASYYQEEIRRRRKAAEEQGLSPGEYRVRWTALQGALREEESARHRPWAPACVICSLLTVNRHGFLFLPFELFSSLGGAISAAAPLDTTGIVGYRGDCLGYLPDEAGFDSAGYEAMSSRFAREAGQEFVGQVLAYLDRAAEKGGW